MKKAKIMLTAITVLAVVGGALAFKAKTFGTQKYCINTTGGSQTCSVFLGAKSSFNNDAGQISYSLTSGTTCPSNGGCNAVGHSFDNGE